MVPFDECYRLDGNPRFIFRVWCWKRSLSFTTFEWLKYCHTPGWNLTLLNLHLPLDQTHQWSTLTPASCRCLHFQREEIISFTENKSLLSTPELNCKSSPSWVLLKGAKEAPGSADQLGFPPSWLAPTPGNAQQAEKQLRHNSIQLALRATLYPRGKQHWQCLFMCGSESLHSFR